METPIDIAGIATACRACDPHAGREMLDLMMSRLPFAGTCLTSFNPVEKRHEIVASSGYDDHVAAYLRSGFVDADPIWNYYQTKGRQQRSLKWSEMPFDYYNTFSVQGIFHPAGYREGITLCLYSRDGRYTGDLHISTDDPRFPSSDMMSDVVERLRTILGNFTDILRDTAHPYAGRVKNGSGCIIAGDGDIVDLPGIARMEGTLRDALKTHLSALTSGEIPNVFMFRHARVWWRVFTGIVGDNARILIAEDCPLPYELTSRELQIIEHLISGATNNEIAALNFVARSTVSKHLENIFDKLGCNSRTSAVSIALNNNLRHLPAPRRTDRSAV
ncbi:response regulator transcription factor [Methylopila musalis]|uniref:Response regulator transcription factor n=1 Tax=Methylopila musalis TaxID=1134781 RepID=A0ABW3Z391_9HYPH